jgi:hypothetical protein
MNIFYLDHNPILCAQYHVDRHVVKQILEYAQLLCSACWTSNSSAPYKLTHPNHPCAKWVRTSMANYDLLFSLGVALCNEYYYRFGKIHKTTKVYQYLWKHRPNIPYKECTPIPLAMPDEFKHSDPVVAYRNYYIGGKNHLKSWKHRTVPNWYKEL